MQIIRHSLYLSCNYCISRLGTPRQFFLAKFKEEVNRFFNWYAPFYVGARLYQLILYSWRIWTRAHHNDREWERKKRALHVCKIQQWNKIDPTLIWQKNPISENRNPCTCTLNFSAVQHKFHLSNFPVAIVKFSY